jgi:7-cyano-7-deazaguanine synthase
MATSDKAIVLLSGGLDSATVLSHVLEAGYEVYALSVDYGQHADRELVAATKLGLKVGVTDHKIVPIGLKALGGSALLEDRPVPSAAEAVRRHGIPETYVPARNTVLLSLALGWAEVVGAYRIFIGANALDYSGYPDCRPKFIEAFNKLAKVAVAEGADGGRAVVVETPLMELTKAQIIKYGLSLGVDYALTVSCYQPAADGRACGRCESCELRLKGFAEAGHEDPITYVGQEDS